MNKLEFLTDSVFNIIEKICQNQTICKYLKHYTNSPLEESDIVNPFDALYLENIFPLPFDENSQEEKKVMLRIYNNDFRFKNRSVEEMSLNFDIVLPKTKDFWLVMADGKPKHRPYQIMYEIIKEFNEKPVAGGFRLVFEEGRIYNVNTDFNQLSFIGVLTSITSGGRK